MLKDLPKYAPSAVKTAVERALEATDNLEGRVHFATDGYRGLKDFHRSDEGRVRLGEMRLDSRAEAIVNWGVMLQSRLGTHLLARRFWISGAAHGPCILAVSTEIEVPYAGGRQGGTLKTELSLVLDPEEGLFRHDDWFDGIRMTGGGLLNSPTSLVTTLHPEMLVRLHDDVAEGKAWPQIEAAIERLVTDRKDR